MAVGKVTEVKVRGEVRYMLDKGFVQQRDGSWKRERLFFNTRRAATTALRTSKTLNKIAAGAGIQFSKTDLEDLAAAKKILDGYKISVAETATFWKAHAGGPTATTTTRDAIAAWFKSLTGTKKKPKKRNLSYLGTIRARFICVAEQTQKAYANKMAAYEEAKHEYETGKTTTPPPDPPAEPLAPFSDRFGDQPISIVALQVGEIDKWLETNYPDPGTFKSVRTQVSSAFNWLRKKKYVQNNPAEEIELIEREKKLPGILKVPEMRAYIEAAAYGVVDPKTGQTLFFPELVPSIAVAAFSGVRDDEIKKLTGDMILSHILHLPGPRTKDGEYRNLKIHPTLRAWLDAFPAAAGRIVPPGARKKLDKIRAAIGLEWPHNALRHSFASYRYAVLQDAEKVIAETRHKIRNTFHDHYVNQKISEEDAKAYWEILPRAPKKGAL